MTDEQSGMNPEQQGTEPAMDLSIIIPLYNEEENVSLLHEAIVSQLASLDIEYEVLLVDDGSEDHTFTVARELASVDRRLRVIKFRKNCGQTPAMAAGIDYARGTILVTMDGDLQNDPADIPRLVDKISEGFDIVVGWRHRRQDKLITRKIPSMIANWIIGKVTGVPIKDNGCSLKAYRANVIKHVPLYSEMHRFIPAMASITGASIAEIKVKHHARKYGASKYGLSRTYKVLLDLLAIKTIISFSARPLVWFSILALPASLISAMTLFFSIYYSSPMDVPLAGVGLMFGALALFFFFSGAVAELAYKTGRLNVNELPLKTAKSFKVEGDNGSKFSR
jgi:glycosyltransferase involved in cell wall biosynthesis